MNVLFAGGGTAGHINPAIAIAQEIIKRNKKSRIAFVGRNGGKENDLIKNAGFPMFLIEIQGLSRSNPVKNLKVVANALKSKKVAKDIITTFSPDVVVGTGGYVCWPVISAAHDLGIKTIIHESNTSLGLTTKFLMRKCDLLLLGFENRNMRKKNVVISGIPLQENFIPTNKDSAKMHLGIPRDKSLIVSVGGSIGAKNINDCCIEVMKNYSQSDESVYHIHSTGHRYFDEIKKSEPDLCEGKDGCKILPYIKDMATMLSAADVVITRCGAVTLAEISFCQTPSILIPSPNVTGNHQKKNAELFERAGAGIMIEESDLSPILLYEKINSIIKDKGTIDKMRKNCKALSLSSPASKIADIIEEMTS